eukprot:gene3758-4678_t
MTERQLVSLESKFSEGNYYDILQSYKALYFRNANAKKYKETVTLLVSGSLNFLKYEQWNCAAELAQLLVETYQNFNTPYNNETKVNIIKIFKGFKGECQGQINFMRLAIKWSAEKGEEKKGAPELHSLLAICLMESGDYIDSQKHFIYGDDPVSFAKLIKKWTEDAETDEVDLYIARGVLSYLCVNNLKDANILFKECTSNIQLDDFTPLLNYIRYLLLTLERNALPLFNVLKEKYAPSIKRDPQFSKYLEQIAHIFYKVPLQGKGGIGSLLSGLFNFGNESSPSTSSSNNNNNNEDVPMVEECD